MDNTTTDIYLAVSKNGGLKFEYFKINETSFKAVKNIFFGDYVGVSAVNGIVRPIWMQIGEDKKLCIYTAIINDSVLANYQIKDVNQIKIEKMIKYQAKMKINYLVDTSGVITASITKPLEPGFEKIVIKDKKVNKGANQFSINAKRLKLPKGNYVLTLYFNNRNEFIWITEE